MVGLIQLTAGAIIPAIATTNAIVSGLVSYCDVICVVIRVSGGLTVCLAKQIVIEVLKLLKQQFDRSQVRSNTSDTSDTS